MNVKQDMKLSEIMDLVKRANPSEYWKPRLWVPEPMDYPITVYILSDLDFEIACKIKKYNKKIGAFAVWGTDAEGNRVAEIYMRYNRTNLFYDELRHLQKGHYHE